MFLTKKAAFKSELGATFPKARETSREKPHPLDESLIFMEIPITFIFSAGMESDSLSSKQFEAKTSLGTSSFVPQHTYPKRQTVDLEEDLTFVEKQVSAFNISENMPISTSTMFSQGQPTSANHGPPKPETSEQSPGPSTRKRAARAKSGREPVSHSRDCSKPPSVIAYQTAVKHKIEGLKAQLIHSRFDFAGVPKAEVSPSRRLRLGASGDAILNSTARATHSAPKNSSFDPDNRKRVSAKKQPSAYHMHLSLREGAGYDGRSSGRLGVSGGNLAASMNATGGTASLLKGLKGESSRSSSRPVAGKTTNRPSSRGLDPQNAAVVAACSLLGTGLTQATVIARRSVNKKAFLDQLLDAFPKATRDHTASNLKRRIRQKCNPKAKLSTEDPSSVTKYNSRSSRDPTESRSSLARLALKKTDDLGLSYPVSLGLKKWELRSEKFQGLGSLGFSSRQSETEYPRTSTHSDFASKAALTRSSLLNLSAKLSHEMNPSSIVSKKKFLSSSSKCQTPAARSSKLVSKGSPGEIGHGSREITKTQPASVHHNVSGVGLSQHLKPSFSEKQKIMSYLSKNQEDIDLNYNTLMDWEKKKPGTQPPNSATAPVRRNLLHTTLLRSQAGGTTGFDGGVSSSGKKQHHVEGFF